MRLEVGEGFFDLVGVGDANGGSCVVCLGGGEFLPEALSGAVAAVEVAGEVVSMGVEAILDHLEFVVLGYELIYGAGFQFGHEVLLR